MPQQDLGCVCFLLAIPQHSPRSPQNTAHRQHDQKSFLYLQNAKISRKTATAPADDTQDTCARSRPSLAM